MKKSILLLLLCLLLLVGGVSADTQYMGYQTAGASTDYWATNTYAYNFTAPADISGATFLSFHTYSRDAYGWANKNTSLKFAIWNPNKTLVANSNTTAIFFTNTTGVWRYANFTSNPTLTPGNIYYLGVITNVSGNTDYRYYYDAGVTNQYIRGTSSYTSPGTVSTITASDHKLSVYITYTTAVTTDTTPPDAVSGLANETPAYYSIKWNWANPANSDFYRTNIYKDGVWLNNQSNTTTTTTFTATDIRSLF